jgi:hypothetical protein
MPSSTDDREAGAQACHHVIPRIEHVAELGYAG